MRFAAIVLCITALMIGGVALAWDSGTEPYTTTGDHDGSWRWYVDPGDRSENPSGSQGYNTNAVGERGCNYAYAWGDGYEDWWYYYDWDDYGWVEGDSGSHTGNYNLQVDADIEMFVNEGMEHNLVYFHRLNKATTMNADWTYWIESNNGMWVFLVFDDDCYWGGLHGTGDTAYPYMDQVNRRPSPYGWDPGSSYGTPPPTARACDTKDSVPDMPDEYYVDNTTKGGSTYDVVLPLDFYMWGKDPGTEAGTWVKGQYSASGNNGNTVGITFHPEKTGVLRYPGYKSTYFRATIRPHAYQPDGRYIIDPTMELSPQM
jgi:hypothetical protein